MYFTEASSYQAQLSVKLSIHSAPCLFILQYPSNLGEPTVCFVVWPSIYSMLHEEGKIFKNKWIMQSYITFCPLLDAKSDLFSTLYCNLAKQCGVSLRYPVC